MTWKCVQNPDVRNLPNYQAVRMLYVKDPRFHEVDVGMGICDKLVASGSEVVTVRFEVHGTYKGVGGFHEIALNGQAFTLMGGSSGSTGLTPLPDGKMPISPLDQDFLKAIK